MTDALSPQLGFILAEAKVKPNRTPFVFAFVCVQLICVHDAKGAKRQFVQQRPVIPRPPGRDH